jgi:hypothetical protein
MAPTGSNLMRNDGEKMDGGRARGRVRRRAGNLHVSFTILRVNNAVATDWPLQRWF